MPSALRPLTLTAQFPHSSDYAHVEDIVHFLHCPLLQPHRDTVLVAMPPSIARHIPDPVSEPTRFVNVITSTDWVQLKSSSSTFYTTCAGAGMTCLQLAWTTPAKDCPTMGYGGNIYQEEKTPCDTRQTQQYPCNESKKNISQHLQPTLGRALPKLK